jgi:hypothetical protein
MNFKIIDSTWKSQSPFILIPCPALCISRYRNCLDYTLYPVCDLEKGKQNSVILDSGKEFKDP